MIKMVPHLLLSSLSFSAFATRPNPACVGVAGATFTQGDGIEADNVGGVVGLGTNLLSAAITPVPPNIFWDTELSGIALVSRKVPSATESLLLP